MNFEEAVVKTLGPIISKNEMKVAIEFTDCIELSSEIMSIRIARNESKNSNSLWIKFKPNSYDTIEIDDYVLKEYFNSDLKLNNVSAEVFLKNLKALMNDAMCSIFLGDDQAHNDLIKFDIARNAEYSRDLEYKQLLSDANEAWFKKDYSRFIHLIENIEISQRPESYNLKLRIAYKHIIH